MSSSEKVTKCIYHENSRWVPGIPSLSLFSGHTVRRAWPHYHKDMEICSDPVISPSYVYDYIIRFAAFAHLPTSRQQIRPSPSRVESLRSVGSMIRCLQNKVF